MPVPGFQEFMRPLLEALADGQIHQLAELREKMAERFALTEAERTELLPSGGKTRLSGTLDWTRTHLLRAGLVERPERGHCRITAAGAVALGTAPEKIDMAYLARGFPAYRQFREKDAPRSATESLVPPGPTELTPQDALVQSFQQLRDELADEILASILGMPPAFFERLVVDLMLKLGYGGVSGAGWHLGQSGDGGIDGVISEDRLGLESIYLQAKRYRTGPIGRPQVQAFVGSLAGRHARKGVFITTSVFTAEAAEYVRGIEHRVVLVDGARLAELMIDAGVGVVPERTYTVNRIDSDYFVEA